MKTNEFIDKFAASDFVRNELPLQMQLGLPYLFKKNNRLYVKFFPHKENFAEGHIEIYERQYSLEVVYPSCRVVKFVDLIYDEKIQSAKKIKDTDAECVLKNWKYVINGIYDSCSEILDFYDRNGKVADFQIEKYQIAFADAVERLGLSELYEVKR